MPGHAKREDVTGILIQQQSWPSYNVPYFSDLWTVGGYADVYSYLYSPRAEMFRRAQEEQTITSFSSFMRFMRYNKEGDPLERGDRCNSISSRCDLNPPSETDFDCYGGIDCKAVRWRSDVFSDLSFFAVSGPSRGVDAPAFSWSTVKNTTVENCKPSQHHGHPEVFDFDWYFMSADNHENLGDRALDGAAADFFGASRLHLSPITTAYTLELFGVAMLVIVVATAAGRGLLWRRSGSSREEEVDAPYIALGE